MSAEALFESIPDRIGQFKNGMRTDCWSSMSTWKVNLEDWAQASGPARVPEGYASSSASSERVPKTKRPFALTC